MTSNTVVRTVLMVCAASTFLSYRAQAQESELAAYLKAGQQDASKMIGAYISPVVEGLSYGLNGGWYHTAKAHKTLGFDLGVSVNAVFIPTSKQFFDPAALNLQTIHIVPTGAIAPTMMGDETKPRYQFNNSTDPNTEFNGPEGLNFKENVGVNAVVMPTAQLGIGIWKGTEIKFRYMPEIEASDTKVKLIGFGVLHDVKQHIPGIKLMPFDLSIMAGFTRFTGVTNLEGTFAKPTNDQRTQKVDYVLSAWLIQALISKKLSVVTFYGGVGYNTIKTDVDLTGSYVVDNALTLKDPFSNTYKNNGLRLNAGVRLKFGPIYLNGDYALQEYSTVSVGLGVSVR